jgi:hypothetical protein
MNNSKQKIFKLMIAWVLTFNIGCKSAKPFVCVWQNPLDYEYNKLKKIDTANSNKTLVDSANVKSISQIISQK